MIRHSYEMYLPFLIFSHVTHFLLSNSIVSGIAA